jgi:hypothetical protein
LVTLACQTDEPVLDDSALHYVLDLAGNHPYFAQLTCSNLLNFRNARQIPILGRADVEGRLTDIFDEGQGTLADIWQRLTPRERMALSCLARAGHRGEARSLPSLLTDLGLADDQRLELNKTIGKLVAREMIDGAALDEAHPPLRVRVGLIREWLKKFKRNAIEVEGLKW